MPDFEGFPKIPRLFRDVVITEKIDGTNAAVGVTEDGEVYAQSRKRLITPEQDNFGFAAWVVEHEDELHEGLGVGLHFGEWYGQGIQRNYGLAEKRFALFNTARWSDYEVRPSCCDVTPVLFQHTLNTDDIDSLLLDLRTNGSRAVPGFMQPEGVIVYHTASRTMFKALLENDDVPKSAAA